ncbi:outer membrane protein [Aminobacter niigataensis]|uniref:Outer membrane protein n=1 Tax=Aminobacter niigataensis TaxID=83265 RepID=A0ABR6L6A6_9HYPH|nr:TolC family protein [Aminobacter niigataensis]MBB4652161.1 outer membrane protein [Aminobacter niigataensis]
MSYCRTAVAVLSACVALAGCANGAVRQVSAPATGKVVTGSVGSNLASINTHPEILAADARRDAAGEEIARARSTLLPSAGIEASAGVAAGDGDEFDSRTTGNAYSYALTVDIPLYQGGRGQSAVAAAKADYRASGEVANDRRVSAAYELALALIEVHRQKGAVVILSKQAAILASLKGGLETELKAGAASRVDVDDVGRQLSRLSVERERARLLIAQASRTALRLGITPETKLPEVSKLYLPSEEQDLIELAVKNNPRVKERDARADAAKARVNQAKGDLLPTVSAGLSVRGGEDTLPGVDRHVAGRGEVRFSMPIYTGGRVSAGIRQRNDENRAAVFEADAARIGVTAAIRSAFDRRVLARRMQTLAQAERRNAASALEGVRAERKVGERSTFDEIRAIADLANSEINLNNARYDLIAAEYTIAAETGLIGELFGVPGVQQTAVAE